MLKTILDKISSGGDGGGGGGSKKEVKGKGKGKAKAIKDKLPKKERDDKPRMPAELIGMSNRTADDDHICYGFNLEGCKGAKPGARCDKGWHVCMKPGCLKSHSQRDH